MFAAAAKSTFASENVQNMWVSEHFFKLRRRKISQLASTQAVN